MLKKVLSYSVISLLALALVGGTAFLLLRPDEVEAQGRGQGWRDREQAAQDVNGSSVDPSSPELEPGHEVVIKGFHEDGEFKAGTVENVSTGQTIILRDEAGHPMWAGRGRYQSTGTEGASVDVPAETKGNTTETLGLESPIYGIEPDGYEGELTQQEVEGLVLALNDEYHAWTVYDQVIQDFGQIRPFVPIQAAEAKHIDSLLALFERYGLPIPENSWVGNVSSFESVSAACATGVDAEISNAELYDDLFSTTEREDILTVYLALQRASLEGHLPAFQRCAT